MIKHFLKAPFAFIYLLSTKNFLLLKGLRYGIDCYWLIVMVKIITYCLWYNLKNSKNDLNSLNIFYRTPCTRTALVVWSSSCQFMRRKGKKTPQINCKPNLLWITNKFVTHGVWNASAWVFKNKILIDSRFYCNVLAFSPN